MSIRRIKPVSSEEENFRLQGSAIRRDSIEPVPVGTLVVKAFRVTGYDRDCDGSLMARLENIDKTGDTTGWAPDSLSLYSDSTWAIDSPNDLDNLADGEAPRGQSATSEKARLLDLVREMSRVITSDTNWATKYDLVLSLAKECRDLGFDVDYYDPDTSYGEDTTACYDAYKGKAEEVAKAFGMTL